MKKIKIAVMLFCVMSVTLLLSLTGCSESDFLSRVCNHEWDSATCTEPKTCSVCEVTEGSALGHTWASATCTAPKTCSVCKATEGSALGHMWMAATCTAPKTCSDCEATEGSALGHTWASATCTAPKTCSDCKATEGEALGHDYSESITEKATCKTEGTKKFMCSNCEESYNESYSMTKYTATVIHDMYEDSVGEITTFDRNGNGLSLGSCFVYSEDGELITNYHVIEDAYSIKVTIDGRSYNVQYVLAYDKYIDIAVLKINASGLHAVTLCKSAHKVGSSVYAFGSSRGLTATFTQGIITYSDREVDGVVYTQHDAAISGGNSGGPLINEYGEVIGINTMTVRDSQNLNFAINISELSNLNYFSKLTVPGFYEKECDVVEKLKNYIKQNGTYKSSDDYYILNLGYDYSSDYSYEYTWYAYYYVSDDYITLDLSVYSASTGYHPYVYFKIRETTGVYEWYYFDEADYVMNGTLYANTWASNSLLGYSYSNINNSSLRSSTRELASSMMNLIIYNINTGFDSINVTADDLGFYNF